MWLCQITQLVAVVNEQNALSSAPVISTYSAKRFIFKKKKIKIKTKILNPTDQPGLFFRACDWNCRYYFVWSNNNCLASDFLLNFN